MLPWAAFAQSEAQLAPVAPPEEMTIISTERATLWTPDGLAYEVSGGGWVATGKLIALAKERRALLTENAYLHEHAGDGALIYATIGVIGGFVAGLIAGWALAASLHK